MHSQCMYAGCSENMLVVILSFCTTGNTHSSLPKRTGKTESTHRQPSFAWTHESRVQYPAQFTYLWYTIACILHHRARDRVCIFRVVSVLWHCEDGPWDEGIP